MSADNYIRFEPNVVQVDHFAVNVSEDTVENLNLESTQYMIVGEHVSSSGSNLNKSYSLIVDHEGVAINTSIPDRRNALSEYALYVEGDVFVNGKIQSSLGGIGNSNVNVGIGGTGNYWQLIQNTNSNSIIYWNGRAVLGNRAHASNTTNTLKIVESAERNIDHAQIAIQNTQNAVFNMAILGTSRESPAIINTTSRSPIEFHVNRKDDYFQQTYGTNETPRYASSNAPHLCIDVNGNVGIHTGCNVPFTYEYVDSDTIARTKTEAAQLHVNGMLFSSNILMFDRQSGVIDNIDNIYIRRRGVWVEASNVKAGTFSGYYSFASNVSINTSTTNFDYSLYVNGNARIESNMDVQGSSTLKDVEVDSTLITLGDASFSNNIYVERDLIVNECLKIKGQLQQLYHDPLTGSNVWCNIDFRPLDIDYNNLNIRTSGDVLFTPFKFGVGVNATDDQVENSLVVRKRVEKMYQLELSDLSTPLIERFAAIGHFKTDDDRSTIDGSLIITTGAQRDERFNNTGPNPQMKQNIYFYPGEYDDATKTILSMIRPGNPPVLGVFSKFNNNKEDPLVPGRVGIHTFSPREALDVNGNIIVSGEYLFIDENGEKRPIGKWLSRRNAETSPNASSLYSDGLYYSDSSAPHVGINTPPESQYGLTVIGGVKSYNGFFDENGQRHVPWFRPDTVTSLPVMQERVYTSAKVGVGVTNIQYPFELASSYGEPVFFALHTGEQNEGGILFFDDNNSWTLQTNAGQRSLQLMRHDIQSSNVALWSTYNDTTNNYRVFIGTSSNITTNTADYDENATLTVGGNMRVLGTVDAVGYRINGQVLINAAIQDADYPSINADDVFIGGNRIFIRPNTGSFMSIGYPNNYASKAYDSSTDSILRVYQPDVTREAIARFVSKGTTGFIDIMTESRQGIRVGTKNNVIIMQNIFDNTNLLTFSYDPNKSQNRYFGLNTTTPTANLHIVTRESGNNMLRLTRISTVDSLLPDTTVASINLEKRIQVNDFDRNATTYRWNINGPQNSFEQKLSFNYSENPTLTLCNVEKFAFTNKGSLGILTSTPQYAIDIACTGKHGSLRMYSECNLWDTPQIIFQNGSQIFGQDEQNDYRFLSASNEFLFEQQNVFNTTPLRLLSFSKSGKVGIRYSFDEGDENNPAKPFECFIGGNLNVTEGIYLNGKRLFSVDDTSSSIGLYLNDDDVILNPRRGYDAVTGVTSYGGLNVNYTSPTSNLFYVAGKQSANVMVWDSGTSNVQLHLMQTSENNATLGSVYRVEMENKIFRVALRQDIDTSKKYISSSSENYFPSYEIQPVQGSETRFNMTVFGDITLGYPDSKVVFSSNYEIVSCDSNIRMNIRTSNQGLIVTQSQSEYFDDSLLFLSNVHFPDKVTRVTNDGRFIIGNLTIPESINDYSLNVKDGILCYGDLIPGNNCNIGNLDKPWKNVNVDGNINFSKISLFQKEVSGNNELQVKFLSIAGEKFADIHVKQFIMDDGTLTVNACNVEVFSTSKYYSVKADPEYKLLVLEIDRFAQEPPVPYAPLWKNLAGNFFNFDVSLSTGEVNTVPTSKFYVYNTSNIPTVNFVSSRGSVFYIDETDNIGIGTTSPSVAYENNVQFQFNQIGSFEQDVSFKQNVDIALDCVVHGDITNDSDLRIKKDLQKIEGALDKVSQLTGYTFTRLHDNARSTGLVAQEIKEVLPEVVRENEEGIYSVAYGNMMGLIVEAIKDLRAELRELRDFIGYQR